MHRQAANSWKDGSFWTIDLEEAMKNYPETQNTLIYVNGAVAATLVKEELETLKALDHPFCSKCLKTCSEGKKTSQ